MKHFRLLSVLVVAALLQAAALAAPATHGVVIRPVVSLHKTPASRAEVVTQAFLGEAVRVAQKRGAWLKVTCPEQYDYPGWIPSADVRLGVAPPAGGRVTVRTARAKVRQAASTSAPVLLEAYLSTTLAMAGPIEDWIKVSLPDGRTGFVAHSDVDVTLRGAVPPRPTPAALVDAARRYMGVPYVWGGMSTKGVDCSGFTHTVYRFCGVRIHRDADQQFDHDGKSVAQKDLEVGDLVFFKTYLPDVVSHVGIYVGDGQVLHASSRVHGVGISKLSDPYLQKRYAGARRILR